MIKYYELNLENIKNVNVKEVNKEINKILREKMFLDEALKDDELIELLILKGTCDTMNVYNQGETTLRDSIKRAIMELQDTLCVWFSDESREGISNIIRKNIVNCKLI